MADETPGGVGVLDNVSKILGRPVKAVGTVKESAAPAAPTGERPSVESILGRQPEGIKLDPLATARIQMYGRARQNGFNPEIAAKTAMSETAIMTPDPSNWRKITSTLGRIPTGTGRTFGDVGRDVEEVWHRAWSNPMGETDENWEKAQKSFGEYIDKKKKEFGPGKASDITAGAYKGLFQFGGEQMSPGQLALLYGTFGESALVRAASKIGIAGAPAVARTLSKLMQVHFTASMLEGTVSGTNRAIDAAKQGNWEQAGQSAVEGLVSGVMARGAMTHEMANDRVRGDLEKTARSLYGNPEGGPLGSNLGSKFDSLDPYKQAEVIHETIQKSPEYGAVVAGVDEQNAKTRHRTERRLEDYHDKAISQAWEPDNVRRIVTNINDGMQRSAGIEAEQKEKNAIEESRQHYLRQIISTIKSGVEAGKAAEEEERQQNEQERQQGIEDRPQRKAAQRQRKAVILSNAEQIRSARVAAVGVREEANRQAREETADRRIPEAQVAEDGHVSYRSTYYGETNSFGVAGDMDHLGVYRQTPRGTEVLTKWGTFSENPQDAYIAPDYETADTIAKLSSLRHSAESLAEEHKTPEHRTEAEYLQRLETDLVTGEKTAKDVRAETGIADQIELPSEVDALRAGELKGPLADRTEAEYLDDMAKMAEEGGFSPEETEALLQQAGTSVRAQAENNLHHITRSGDYIKSKNGTTLYLDSRGMMHPDDGGAPFPLLKNGRYSEQALHLAKTGTAGWGGRTREQRRTGIAKQRSILAMIDLVKPEINEAIDHVLRVAQQNQGLESTPEDLPSEVEPAKRERGKLFGPPNETRKAVRNISDLIQQALESTGANEVVQHIAKENGVSVEEVLRQKMAQEDTPQGQAASLEIGDKITDPFRKGKPWVVERAPGGGLQLRSGNANPLRLDRMNPSPRVLGLLRTGELEQSRAIAPQDVEHAAFEAPHAAYADQLAEQVRDIRDGKQVVPEPRTGPQARAQIDSARRRSKATLSRAIYKQRKALNPRPGTTERDSEVDVAEAVDAQEIAEAAAAQEAEAESQTTPKDSFPPRAPISIGLRGNAGVIRQNGQEFPMHYEAVPLDGVQTSHQWEGNRLVIDQQYPKPLQPRTISEYQSKQTALKAAIRRPGSTLHYEFREYADRTISGSMGPAILEQGGRAVSGNRRLAIMRKHLQNIREITDPVEREVALAMFRDQMRQLARENGIEIPLDDRDYVVVRMLDDPIDTQRRAAELGRLFNKSVSEQMTESAKGVSFARSLTDDNIATIGRLIDDHDGLTPAIQANPEYFAKLVTDQFGVVESEYADWFEPVDPDKPELKLNERGKSQLSKVLLGTVIRDSSLLNAIEGEVPYRALERSLSNLMRLAAIPERDITPKIIQAVQASADTLNTDPSMSLVKDKWAATYRPDQVEFLGMETPRPPEPDRMTEAIWRALHASKVASPRVFNDRILALIGGEDVGNMSMFGPVHETPAEVFSRVFAKEFGEVAHSRKDSPNAFRGISQKEYDAALQNVEFSDQEHLDALRAESGKPLRQPTSIPAHEIFGRDPNLNPPGWGEFALKLRPDTYSNVDLKSLIPTQESVKLYRVDDIHHAFDASKANPLEVLRVNGENYLVDGHHTAAGALRAGIRELPANIYEVAHSQPKPEVKKGALTPPPFETAKPATPEKLFEDAKAEKGYVTPDELQQFLAGHPGTKESTKEIMRVAQMMAEYVYDADPPGDTDRKDALGWVLRERVTKLERGAGKGRGSYSDPLIEKGLGTGILKLTEAADETSFIHEFAHVIFPLLSEQDHRDINTILHGDYPAWDVNKPLRGSDYRNVSEKLAHGLEKFLRDENPTGFSAEVKAVLAKVKEIFRKVYLRFVGDPLAKFKLSEEAKGVFAKMFHIEDTDLPTAWSKEVKAAKAEEKRLKGPLEQPHPVAKIATEMGAAGIRKNFAGKVTDTVGDRVDQKKPVVTLFYPTADTATAAWMAVGTPESKVQNAELIEGDEGFGIRFNTDQKIPLDVLYQELPKKHPGIELEELKRKLAATPASAPLVRKVYEKRIADLENQVRARFGTEERKPEEQKPSLEEAKNAKQQQTVPGLRRLPERPVGDLQRQSTGPVLRPAVLGGKNDAAVRRTGGPLPGTRQLANTKPVGLQPQRERGTPVGITHGQPFDANAWKEGLAKAGLPKNAPPPTVTLSPETAYILKYGGQKQIVQLALTALDQGDGFMLASGTGTGKTVTTSAIAKEFLNANPAAKILYVTKNTDLLEVGDTSFKQTAKSLFGLDVKTSSDSFDVSRGTLPAGVYGATYQRLLGNDAYKKADWDLVIADESGEMRNWFQRDNQQGKAAMEVIRNSKKAVYSSATPWHSPSEYGYAEKLNLWEKGKFEKWIADNFNHERLGDRIVAKLDPGKQAILRNQLVERGQFVSQMIPYEGFTTHFGVVPVTDEVRRSLNRIHEGVSRAKAALEASGKRGLAARLGAFEATYTKAYLERTRVPEAIQLAKKARDAGWNVLIFSETTSGDLFRRPLIDEDGKVIEEAGTYRLLDQEMNGELSRLMPEFGNVFDDLKKAFGDQIADFSGGRNTDAQRQEAKKNFNDGNTPMMYTTYAAGGVGHSFHDTAGNKPRFSIFLGPPYSGVLLDQALGRTWRFGTRSNAMAAFLATDSVPDINLMATKIGPRMRALRASVQGQRDALGTVMGNYTDEEKQRTQQDLLAYDQGNEVKVDAQSFQQRPQRQVSVDNWAQINIPNAAEAHNKGMQVQMAGTKDNWATLYQDDSPRRRQFNRPPPTMEELAARRKVNRVAESIAKGSGVPPDVPEATMEPGTRDAIAGGAAAVGTSTSEAIPEGNAAAAGKMAAEAMYKLGWRLGSDSIWRNVDNWAPRSGSMEFPPPVNDVKTKFYLNGFWSSEVMVRDIARQAGAAEAGRNLVIMNRRFTELTDKHYADYANELGSIAADHKIDFGDKETMRQIWAAVEGKEVSKDENINKAADRLADLMELVHADLAAADVKLTTPDGRVLSYKDIAADRKYMPHRIDWDAKIEDPLTKEVATLKEIMGKTFSQEKRSRMLQAMADSMGTTPAEAADYLNRQKTTPPIFGSIHRARTANFPIYKQDLNTLMGYFNQAAGAIARERVFGGDLGKLRAEIGKIPSENGRTTIEKLFDQHFRPQDWNTLYGRVYNLASGYEALTKMNWSTVKVPFHLLNVTYGMGGFKGVKPLTKAMLRSVFDRENFQKDTAAAGTVIRQINPMLLMEEGARSGFAHWVLQKEGFNATYRWGRAVAGAAAKVYMEQYAMDDLTSPNSTQADATRRILKERMLISDHAIDQAIERGEWSIEDLQTAQRAFTNFTMFSDNPLQMPELARLDSDSKSGVGRANFHRLVRMSYLLQSFAVKIHSLVKETVFEEARAGNYRPLTFLILTAPVFGQMLKGAAAAIPSGVHRGIELAKGDDHQRDSWDRYLDQYKALYGDHPIIGFAKWYVDGIAGQFALEQLRIIADPLMDALEGHKKQARDEFRYQEDDLEEQTLGGAEHSAANLLGLFWHSLITVPLLSDHPTEDEQKNFTKWLRKEFPSVKLWPGMETTSKKPTSETQTSAPISF